MMNCPPCESSQLGDLVEAGAVQSPPSEDELRALIRNRLRSSRVPERIVVLNALPYNEMGKLLRREIRRLFVAR